MTVDEKGLADELRPYASKTQGSIRIDVSEVAKIVAALDRLTAYESDRSAEPVAWVEPCDIAALDRIKGIRGGTRIAALKAFPHKGDVALYAHPTPEASDV